MRNVVRRLHGVMVFETLHPLQPAETLLLELLLGLASVVCNEFVLEQGLCLPAVLRLLLKALLYEVFQAVRHAG